MLERIADTKITQLDRLLPWHVAPMLAQENQQVTWPALLYHGFVQSLRLKDPHRNGRNVMSQRFLLTLGRYNIGD